MGSFEPFNVAIKVHSLAMIRSFCCLGFGSIRGQTGVVFGVRLGFRVSGSRHDRFLGVRIAYSRKVRKQ